MSSAIAKPEDVKFDLSKLTDKVQAKVQNTLAELIDDDTWKSLISNEIYKFCNDTVTKTGYGESQIVHSKLGVIIVNELTTYFQEKVREMLNSPDWTGKWEHGPNGVSRTLAGNHIEQLVLKHSGQILNSVVGSMFQQVIQQMSYNR
jgi:hypothetical protein